MESMALLRARPDTARRNWKHGDYGSPTYRTWIAMKRRCTNPNCLDYPQYGGRGISVCKRWADSYLAFVSDMGKRPEARTIDRINSDGDYEPFNCRWATASEQQHNTRKFRRKHGISGDKSL